MRRQSISLEGGVTWKSIKFRILCAISGLERCNDGCRNFTSTRLNINKKASMAHTIVLCSDRRWVRQPLTAHRQMGQSKWFKWFVLEEITPIWVGGSELVICNCMRIRVPEKCSWCCGWSHSLIDVWLNTKFDTSTRIRAHKVGSSGVICHRDYPLLTILTL